MACTGVDTQDVVIAVVTGCLPMRNEMDQVQEDELECSFWKIRCYQLGQVLGWRMKQ